MSLTRLLICDRHRLFRQGVARRLECEAGLSVIADAATGREALRLTARHRPHVLVLDLGITSPSGLEVLNRVNAWSRPPAVVVTSEHVDLAHLLTAYHAGATAYVPKDAEFSSLLHAVRSSAEGPERLTLARLHDLHRRHGHRTKLLPEPRGPVLSAREKVVLGLLVAGSTNRDIATRLKLREKTVRNLLTDIYLALGVRNRTEAALYAVKTGLVSPPDTARVYPGLTFRP